MGPLDPVKRHLAPLDQLEHLRVGPVYGDGSGGGDGLCVVSAQRTITYFGTAGSRTAAYTCRCPGSSSQHRVRTSCDCGGVVQRRCGEGLIVVKVTAVLGTILANQTVR